VRRSPRSLRAFSWFRLALGCNAVVAGSRRGRGLLASRSGCESSHNGCGTTRSGCESSHTRRGCSHTRCESSHTRCESSHTRCGCSHTRCESSHTRCGCSHTRCESSHTRCASGHTRCALSHKPKRTMRRSSDRTDELRARVRFRVLPSQSSRTKGIRVASHPPCIWPYIRLPGGKW
jgi:hypothetical protein